MDCGWSGSAGDTSVGPWQQPYGVQAAWQGRGTAAKVDALRTEPEQAEKAAVELKVEEGTVEVPMALDKVWDASAERWRVDTGEVWPVEASSVLVEGEERWMLDDHELPAKLNEQAYMWQREQGVDGGDDRRQEWLCSGCMEAWCRGARGAAGHRRLDGGAEGSWRGLC